MFHSPILLIANYRHDRQESMQRYADMLEAGLRERGVSVRTIRPEPYFGRLKPAGHGVGKWLGYIDKFVIFPIRLRWIVRKSRNRATDHLRLSDTSAPPSFRPSDPLASPLIVHICDHSNAMYAAHLQGVPHLVTCHDLLAVRSALGHFPQNPVSWSGRLLQKWVLRGLRQAHTVICDSESTRTDLLNASGRSAERTHTVYLGLNSPYRPMSGEESAVVLAEDSEVRDLGAGGYLFHIGGNQWYKNREGLLRIYFYYIREGGELPLVLAGKPATPAMQQLIAKVPTGARVIQVGHVSNKQLNALYARAATLVFPSLYEGFGWPVLEALTVGCPVVCSWRASLREVGGDGATYIDPADEPEAAKVLHELLDDPAKRQANVRRGLLYAQNFSNDTMLVRLSDLYRSLERR